MRLELKHLNCAIILHLQHNSLVAYGTRLLCHDREKWITTAFQSN